MVLPNTFVRTSHSLSIKVGSTTVGLINGWNPRQSRATTPIYEVDISDSGNPVEVMPGNVTGQTISIARYDTYPIRMEQAFGTPDIIMLSRQSEPFVVHEVWEIPASTDQDRFIYEGCWFNDLGRTIRSDDNRIVNANATLTYTKKLKLSGFFGDAADWVRGGLENLDLVSAIS